MPRFIILSESDYCTVEAENIAEAIDEYDGNYGCSLDDIISITMIPTIRIAHYTLRELKGE